MCSLTFLCRKIVRYGLEVKEGERQAGPTNTANFFFAMEGTFYTRRIYLCNTATHLFLATVSALFFMYVLLFCLHSLSLVNFGSINTFCIRPRFFLSSPFYLNIALYQLVASSSSLRICRSYHLFLIIPSVIFALTQHCNPTPTNSNEGGTTRQEVQPALNISPGTPSFSLVPILLG